MGNFTLQFGNYVADLEILMESWKLIFCANGKIGNLQNKREISQYNFEIM